jgi:ABC-type multidrug transport system fused ATPase/permease subunit
VDGEDIHLVEPKRLREKIAFVPQKTILLLEASRKILNGEKKTPQSKK